MTMKGFLFISTTLPFTLCFLPIALCLLPFTNSHPFFKKSTKPLK